MGKENGIIRDGVKGGNWARVVNGALQVRVVAGGGSSITFPITQAQGGTGRSSAIAATEIVFSDGTQYQGDAKLTWDGATFNVQGDINQPGGKKLFLGGVDLGGIWNFFSNASVNGAISIQTGAIPNGGSLLSILAGGNTAGNATAFIMQLSCTSMGNMILQQNGSGLIIYQAITLGSGDAGFQATINGGVTWTWGIDQSDSSIFKLAPAGALGIGSDVLAIHPTTGNFAFGANIAPDANYKVKITASSDNQLALNAPSGQRFTTLALLNNDSLVGFFSHDHTNSYNMLGYNSTRMVTWDATGAVIGVNQGAHEAGFLLAVTGTAGAFGPPRMTTTQRDALNGSTPVKGMIIYNTTTDKFQGYNGAWGDFF